MPELTDICYTEDEMLALLSDKLSKGASDGVERVVKDGALALSVFNVRLHTEPDGTVYLTSDGTDPDPNA